MDVVELAGSVLGCFLMSWRAPLTRRSDEMASVSSVVYKSPRMTRMGLARLSRNPIQKSEESEPRNRRKSRKESGINCIDEKCHSPDSRSKTGSRESGEYHECLCVGITDSATTVISRWACFRPFCVFRGSPLASETCARNKTLRPLSHGENARRSPPQREDNPCPPVKSVVQFEVLGQQV